MNPHRIAPRSGVAFRLEEGETLTVVDPQGGQVSDCLLLMQTMCGKSSRMGALSITRRPSPLGKVIAYGQTGPNPCSKLSRTRSGGTIFC